jgi:hypothetical protein
MDLVQSNMGIAVAASAFLNVGIILATVGSPAGQMSLAARGI